MLLCMRIFQGFVPTSTRRMLWFLGVKFENGLRPEIYQYICFHEIRDFDDAGKARVSY